MRFLGDEHVPRRLLRAVRDREPALEFFRVGMSGMPAMGSTDTDLLRFAEAGGYAILTNDVSTMPAHAQHHLAAGYHTWGVFLITTISWRQLIESLLTLWGASEAEEWRDQVVFLPL
jgi:hypothetical protein